ncbi:protein giant-like [Watersipora subatra]|uniref:protein giant-like n=1 Tax=Watersipora subatra TaxID=2589382 RepID=UPI00355C184F
MTENPKSGLLTSWLTSDRQTDCSSTGGNSSHDSSGAAFTVSMAADSAISSVVPSTFAANKGGSRKMTADKTADEKYREKRNRNNAAAKRSRDSKQAKLDSTDVHVSFLKRELGVETRKAQIEAQIMYYQAELSKVDNANSTVPHQLPLDHK